MQYSNETNQVLISMYYGSSVEKNYFDTVTLHSLFNDKYIWYTAPRSNMLCLTDAGKAYVENLIELEDDKKYSRFRDNVNLFLAICGIVLSIIAIIISIVKP